MKRVVCVLSMILSFSSFANGTDCEQLIIDKFETARDLYLSEVDVHDAGYQNPKLALWKVGVDKLNQTCAMDAIDLPLESQVSASDLYSLMQAYITGKGKDEWQTKFTLALICHETPLACEKYINKQSDADLEALWNGVVD